MKSSDLKYRINIFQQHVEKTEFGRTNISFDFKCSCRARVNYLSGTRTVDNDEIFYSVDREFIVRSYVPVDYTDIIEYDKSYWQVLSVDPIHSYNDIVIKTSRINNEDIKINTPKNNV